MFDPFFLHLFHSIDSVFRSNWMASTQISISLSLSHSLSLSLSQVAAWEMNGHAKNEISKLVQRRKCINNSVRFELTEWEWRDDGWRKKKGSFCLENVFFVVYLKFRFVKSLSSLSHDIVSSECEPERWERNHKAVSSSPLHFGCVSVCVCVCEPFFLATCPFRINFRVIVSYSCVLVLICRFASPNQIGKWENSHRFFFLCFGSN